MKGKLLQIKIKLSGLSILKRFFHTRTTLEDSKASAPPISLVLHWLGIGDIIVCGAILRGFQIQHPGREINFYLRSNTDIDEERFLAWAQLVWPNCFITRGAEFPGEVFEVGHPDDPNADPERLGLPGLRHDLWADMCGTSAEVYALRPSSSGLDKAKKLLESLDVKGDKPVVYLSPVTANKWRNWPIEKWVDLEQSLRSLSIQVIIGALKTESWASKQQLDTFSTSNFIGQFEPEVLLGILGLMDCIVSNDSGFAHLGGVVCKPTVAVCGGNYDGYACFGWYSSVHVVQASSRNIDDIEVNKVFEAIISSVYDSDRDSKLRDALVEHNECYLK